MARANQLFTRPWLDLTPGAARERVDPWGLLGDWAGKDVLCLAGGGGQQSAAFALTGARVTVFDLSEDQLERDREVARHHALAVRTVRGDMRDLRQLAESSFDIVCHPYSINYLPDCREVFAQVARVLRPGGIYTFWAANPFAAGVGTRDWNGSGYEVRHPYVQGGEISYEDESWAVADSWPARARVNGPREHRQLLSTLLNGLADEGFVLLHMREETGHEPSGDPTPGEWDHFTAVLPPWLAFWARLRPEAFGPSPPQALDRLPGPPAEE
jgi:SAM-dependent methyltransferase